jgi:hypothetical protein
MSEHFFADANTLLLGGVTGFVFGFLLQKGGVADFRVIVGQFLLKDFTMLKVMLSAVVVGAIGIYGMRQAGQSRPEKNLKLLRQIISKDQKTRFHIVGELARAPKGVTHHGLISKREDLFALMGRTKTVVCPSLFDAAPGVLFEAAAMNCNVVASKNCGNWQLCHEDLLADPHDLPTFLERIERSLSKKFEDNMDFFLRQNSYQSFIDLVAVF